MSIFISSIGFGLVTASIITLAAVGFTLQFGATNILNLAFGDVMIASAFVAYLANNLGLNIWLCVLVGAVFGALASLLLNRLLFTPFLRRGTKLFGMVIVTLAAGLVIQNILLAITGSQFVSYSMDVGRTVNLGSVVLTTAQLVQLGIDTLVL